MAGQGEAKARAAGDKPAARTINLDALRAARAEAAAEPVTVTFHGEAFVLPPEVPFDFADALTVGRHRDAIAVLFGDDADRFFGLRPSLNDIKDLTEAIAGVYGASAGESKASSDS